MHLAQKLLTNSTCSGASGSFAKETRALKMKSAVDSWWKLTTTESYHQATPLTTTEGAEELSIDQSMVIQHLKQTGKLKKLNKWVFHELTANQKKIVLKCHLLLLYTTTNHFFYYDCDMRQKADSIQPRVTISSVVGLRKSFKALPKAKRASK